MAAARAVGAGCRRRRSWRRWGIPVLLLAAFTAVFGAAAGHSFHYDDLHSIVENPHIRGLTGAPGVFADPGTFSRDPERAMFRPLVVLSYALNYRMGGLDGRGYHLVNLLLHALCAGVVGWLAVLLRLARTPWPAAALFAFHPLNVEVATYVSARSESLAALGLLACLASYVHARRRAGRRGWLALAALSMVVGLLAKATAIAAAALVGLWEACTRRGWMPIPFGLIAVAYVLHTRTAVSAAVGEAVRPLLTQWLTQLKAPAYYGHLVSMPVRLSVEHAFTETDHLTPTVVAAAALLFSVLCLIWPRPGDRHRFLLVSALLALAPASLIPLNVLVNEHRMYPALALLAPVLAIGGGRARAGWGAPPALWVWLVLLAALSAQRVQVWGDSLRLWEDAALKAPRMYRTQLHLGGELEKRGEMAAAVRVYRRAVELAPDNEQVHYNLANALRAAGDTAGAVQAYRHSLRVTPGFRQASINLAALYADLGRVNAALGVLSRAIDQHGENAELYRRRAVVHIRAGHIAAAEADYRRALQLDPDHAEIHFGLGNLLFDTRRDDAAAHHYAEALRLQPGHAGATYNLADLALRRGDAGQAQRVIEAALLVGPVQEKLFYLLGQAYEQQGDGQRAIASYRRFLRARAGTPAALEKVRQRLQQLSSGPDTDTTSHPSPGHGGRQR